MAEAASVPKHQSSQVLELNHCKVGKCGCLVTLNTKYSDSDMSGLDHADIVEAITDRQGQLFAFEFSLD